MWSLQEVLNYTKLSRPTIYRMMANGTFPKQLSIPSGYNPKVRARRAVWDELHVIAWKTNLGQSAQEAQAHAK